MNQAAYEAGVKSNNKGGSEMSNLLKEIGITKEELQEKVIEKVVRCVLSRNSFDEDGNVEAISSDFSNRLNKLVQEKIQSTIDKIASKSVLPNVEKYIKDLKIQKTNHYGEAKAEPQTIVEYLIQTAENYMTEKVNYDGKTKSQSDSYSWKGEQTRVTHMVHQYLHYSIETAMKNALQNANSQIVKGLEETCKLKLSEISNQLQISVKTK
jgi:hypothetical protein